jgi:hypothetical protein
VIDRTVSESELDAAAGARAAAARILQVRVTVKVTVIATTVRGQSHESVCRTPGTAVRISLPVQRPAAIAFRTASARRPRPAPAGPLRG